jgi:hypothetical protein
MSDAREVTSIAMEAAAVSRSRWTFAQWGTVVLVAVQLTWALAG